MLMSDVLNNRVPEHNFQSADSIFVSNSFVGIEIEMENVPTESLTNVQSWNRVSEGSIDGYELVLRRPSSGDRLFLAIQELNNISSVVDLTNSFSERTSIHIHVDIRDMTYSQFINFLTLSVMFEKVLYKYVAPHRSSNHFCWSFFDCQALVSRIKKVNDASRTNNIERLREAMRNEFRPEVTKYSGINVSSVPRYGSLEFRMHEGTMNTNKIIRWINILLSIKNYAMDEGRTPSNILETKQDVGIDSIFTAVLGNYRGILTYDGVETDILDGIRSAQDFVYQLTTAENINYSAVLPNNNPDIFTGLLRTINTDYLSESAIRRIQNV